jgi:serine/threonine protein kinase
MGFLEKLTGLFGSKKKGPPKAVVTKGDRKLPRIDLEKRFELVGRTGQGSMSKVWRATDRKTGKTVCVKVLDKEKTAKFDARFPGLQKPQEGTILSLLKHKNIVTTFEHGMTTKGEQYIVMELIDGVGLNFMVETRTAQLADKRISYLIQLCDAMEFMHKNKFLHRDICPRNVMITKDNLVKLIDFGLSVPYTPEFCRPGNRTGTAEYLAPEIIKRRSTDHRVDLFALGVTAYEMFTGQLPWEKADSTQTLLNHMNSVGRDPREFVKDMDTKIAQFLIKAIERDPDRRFQSAAEFRDALKLLSAD